ncbi:MAG TPA: hypothetical protein VM452_04705 [Caulifigura sp.]|nr:hypothetical protein [Caulifigura sp.]
MPATIADLDDFHTFAARRVREAPDSFEFGDLVRDWLWQRQCEEIRAIVRQGKLDIEAGRGRDAFEHAEEVRIKFGLSR